MLKKLVVLAVLGFIVSLNVSGDSRFGIGAQADVFEQVLDEYQGGTLNAGAYISLYDFSDEKYPTQGLLLKLSATSPFDFHMTNTDLDQSDSWPLPFGEYWRVVFEAGPAFRFEENRIEWLLLSTGIYTGAVAAETMFIVTFGIYGQLTLVIPLSDSVGLDIGIDATARVIDFSPAILHSFNYSFSPRIGLSFAPVSDSPQFRFKP